MNYKKLIENGILTPIPELDIPEATYKPVMETFNVDQEEAVTRIRLMLTNADYQKLEDPGSETFQRFVDTFLSKSSDQLIEEGILENLVVDCLADKKFVEQFDRLMKCNIAKLVREKNSNPTAHSKMEMHKFKAFVREYVFERFIQKYGNQ